MREIIYFSKSARTSGNFDDLMQAGRMDIAVHVIINTFFVSHHIREGTKLHLVFYGQPDPPKHIEMQPTLKLTEGGIDISKKDVAGLIKRILYKYRKGQKTEVAPGYWVEKKNLFDLLEELKSQGKTIYILDKGGEDIRNIKFEDNPVFLLGDHEGIGKELKRLKKTLKTVSLGKTVYFASQTVTIVNHELDRQGI